MSARSRAPARPESHCGLERVAEDAAEALVGMSSAPQTQSGSRSEGERAITRRNILSGAASATTIRRRMTLPDPPRTASTADLAVASASSAGAMTHGGGGAASGLVRSKSVMDRLDTRFKGAALFDRTPASDDSEWPMDEVLMSLAKRQRSFGGIRLFRYWATALAQDRGLRVAVALAAGGGAATCGAVGGACGLVLGSVAGAVAGTAPAVLTFGLSVPTGAVAGGALGSSLGAIASGSVGFVSGGAIGAAAYQSTEQLLQGAAGARVALGSAVAVPIGVLLRTVASARAGMEEASADQKVRVAAASAAGGALALGTSGGALGLLLGGATGAAWGVIPAFITFGLSIPVCATVVGTFGMWTGAAVGGAAGLAGGGAAGYGVAACVGERDFHECVEQARDKARSWSRGIAVCSMVALAEPGGTGGTA
mmetsp:Transcript_95525/g.275825  ORF Transcript_95525/g.275825 Transcript_95525/m.275825 type:complete len:426 (-) Transcript_95525:178-1455(-)